MSENYELTKAFMIKISHEYDEYAKYKECTLKKIKDNSQFFEGIKKEIFTNRKTKPELLEKYFKHSLYECAEEVSIKGNLMRSAHERCMQFYTFYNKTQQRELDEYQQVKKQANEFIEKIRVYFYNYECGNVPFPKITYTK